MGKKKWIRKKGKTVLFWGMILICYLYGLRACMDMETPSGVPVFFSSEYPDEKLADAILETELEADQPADICFYWNGGLKRAKQGRDGRETEVMVAGLKGMASLYDWRAGSAFQERKNGCLIDRGTALELYRTTQAVGSCLILEGEEYEVRKVLPWNQKTVVINMGASSQTDSGNAQIFTSAYIRTGNGKTTKSTAEKVMQKYGISCMGMEAGSEKSWAMAALLLFPLAFMAERLRIHGEGLKDRIWNGLCIIIFCAAIFWLWTNLRIPKDWIPGKWSDFRFWSEKIQSVREELRLSIMMPKTASQAENILLGVRAAAGGIMSLVLFLMRRDAPHQKEDNR